MEREDEYNWDFYIEKCFEAIFSYTTDPTICENVELEEWRNKCHLIAHKNE